jgi:ketosteroid isomerase-like protein
VPSRLAKSLLLTSPAECEQAFYEALENADAEAMAELWLDDEDVCCVHPGGARLLGYAAVRASWGAILDNGAVHARSTLKRAVEAAGLALHNVIEEVVVTQGRAQRVVQVIATNAYVKTPAGWKMILHHASTVPDGEAAEVEVPPGPLH